MQQHPSFSGVSDNRSVWSEKHLYMKKEKELDREITTAKATNWTTFHPLLCFNYSVDTPVKSSIIVITAAAIITDK